MSQFYSNLGGMCLTCRRIIGYYYVHKLYTLEVELWHKYIRSYLPVYAPHETKKEAQMLIFMGTTTYNRVEL